MKNERKVLINFKSGQRCTHNPIKTGDGNSCKSSQPLQMVNPFIEKLHPRRSNLIAQSSIAFHNANAKGDVRLTLIAMLAIHQLCKYIYIYIYTLFYISNTFISKARLKLPKNQANARQHPEVICNLKIIHILHPPYHPKR